MMRRRRWCAAVVAAAIAPLAPEVCGAAPTFSAGITTGNISNSAITEASGIVASRVNVNVLWTNEDSGNPAQIYAMTPEGVNLGTYTLSGAGATDWEDITIGPGPVAGTQYIYVGDIGDNSALRATVSVYRVAEPSVSDTQSPVTSTLSGVSKFTFAYPDGARDAESLLLDPLTKDLYIISKRDATKHVYRAPYPQSTSGTITLQLVTTLNNANWITAADMSPDGDEIIMRAGATDTGLMYTRPSGGSVADALATTPIAIPLLSEVQGEAIGFDPQGWGYYTTSEGAGAPVHYYNRLSPGIVTMYWDNDGVAGGTHIAGGMGMGGSGTWDTASKKWYNGSADVPWVSGFDAVFWGTAGTVTLTTAQSANSLSFKSNGYTVMGSPLTLAGAGVTVDSGVTATIKSTVSGTSGLVKNGGGTLLLTTANSYSGATTVTAGKLRLAESMMSSSSLIVQNGATAELLANGEHLIKNGALSITGTGKLDLNDNDLIVEYGTSANPFTTIRGYVFAGYSATPDATKSGIISSTGQSAGNTILALFDNALVSVSGFAHNSVIGKYTYFGDVDLDGQVTPGDYGILDANFGTTPDPRIAILSGDADFDGVVTPGDYGILDANFGAGTGSPLAPRSVPETTSLVLLTLCVAFSRRR